ncbi:DUF1329 domain-containing protein [Paraburkholderia sacchari]|uniref:DUF1329 domain-containing protein n=1 Tax=Paraburkholderia sacchari TaxID=159450 RepID=UPI0039A513CF
MRILKGMVTGLGAMLVTGAAMAGVSQQEATALGTSLTEFGAEQAGNADKTIPAYTGGLHATTAPAGWKQGSGRYDVGPYDGEKPLYSITAANYQKYSDKLTGGTAAMFKKYPQFRMDVYPTHRSIAHSSDWLAHCKTNALNATISSSGNAVDNAHSCVPFPIPKTGAEVVWNSVLTDIWGPHTDYRTSTWLVDADGHLTDIGRVDVEFTNTYQDPKSDTLQGGVWQYQRASWVGPPSQVGTKILATYPMDYDKADSRVWVYMPGQRRTRLAPEFSYDTPVAADGGALNYDERMGFNGSLDRYDFKIVGKKEVYVMYNANRMMFAPTDKLFSKSIVNPDVSRWELHRVWVVEATLKPGKRHVEPRRTFYIDEDSWTIAASDAYDQAGNLFKVGFYPTLPIWDAQAVAESIIFYDLSRGTTYVQAFSRPDDMMRTSDKIGNLSRLTAAALTESGVR